MIHKHSIKLLALGDDGQLPTEFRLFKKGWNDTEKGSLLFDDTAAKSVMEAYKAWGVDLMIDLEHQSLDGKGADPTARDARGWCRLELRPDGSLWACDVKWTPDGAARLQEKRQRYVSPACDVDPETKRVTKMINVAITAIPATHNTPALVAASVTKGAGMDPKMIKAALEAIENGDDKAATEILKNLIAAAAGADPAPEGDDGGSEGDGAPGTAPPATTESVEDPKVVANSDASDEDDEDEDKPAKKTEQKAMRALLRRITDSKTFGEALVRVGEYRASHMTLETERTKLAAERATLESAERRQLVVSLVTLGAEFPATVWTDDTAKAMKPRWANMPIAELRAHVADQRAARKAPEKKGGIKTDTGSEDGTDVKLDDGTTVKLSASELAICTSMKCAPKDYAALRAFRDGKKGN